MCCLFGIYNYSGDSLNNLSNLTNILAKHATERGTDATGIAYNASGKLVIHKEGRSADMIDLKHPDSTVCVTGHTRHATQGDKKKNFNNHPFGGSCGSLRFALAHNGILTNDTQLKEKYHLPKTKIATDSFVAVQLIEKQKELNADTLKFMAEKVSGSFAFSVLDTTDTLWLVRGDSPLSVIHLPEYKLYVYASTAEILYRALIDTRLFNEIKQRKFEDVPINPGDILSITPDGTVAYAKFDYVDYSGWYNCRWWEHGVRDTTPSYDSYIDDLKMIAGYRGYSSEDVDELIQHGFSPEEIEEYMYC